MGVGGVFQIGKSGMQAARAGVSTAGHNIANANTEGYTRQRVQQTALKVGLSLILLLMVFALYNDISRVLPFSF